MVTGDVGLSPGTAFTNTGCTITGATPPASNAAAVAARTDFVSAYAAILAQSRACTQTLSSLDTPNLAGADRLYAAAKTGDLTLTGSRGPAWFSAFPADQGD